ncbi:MAG: amidase [Pseudomonadota bacterium]
MSAFVSRFILGGDGPTVAVKDSIDIEGFPTRAGSAALEESAPAAAHADVVQSLLDAGWRIVGKASMHELAYGMTGINQWAGTPVNPQDASLIPGGSSSGSATAVGGGEADGALGSDTGGSIRVPAACCGVIGFKPTFGRVSRRGAWPRESSLDCVGPFAREMAVLNRLMAAIAPGFDEAAAGVPMAGARIGVLAQNQMQRPGSDPRGLTPDSASDFGQQIATPVREALAAALAASGWHTQTVELAGMQAAFEAGLTIINRETWNAFGNLTKRGQLGADVERRLLLAATTTDAQLLQAEQVRERFTAAVDRALAQVDALALPTLPTLPPSLAEVDAGASVIATSALVRPFNLSGHPALSIPIPVPGSALKAGLQLVGRKGDDERLCALGLHLQQVLRHAASPNNL